MFGILIFAIAILAAATMGFANQRGGTCTVAAIEEIIEHHTFGRVLALLETSLWIAGGLILLGALGKRPLMPEAYAATLATIAGGILFGIGALVNRACAFGSIARLGSGDWAYLATPVGYFAGSLAGAHLPAPGRLHGTSFLLAAPMWLALLAAVMLVARCMAHASRIRRDARSLAPVWSPHLATMVIGLTFLVGLVAAGSWTYTEFLTDLARGNSTVNLGKVLLNVALLSGAIVGGWSAGKLRAISPSAGDVLRTFTGGAIMGLGGALIPGGNTGLVLLGLPMLWSYAWLAFVTICVTIYVILRFGRGARAG